MPLKAVMDSIDELPDELKELYSERDGKFELTGIQGVKSEEDVRRLQSSLEKERGEHKSTREKFKVWGDLEHDEVMGRLDRIPELEAAAADKIDDAKLEEMAESRALTRLKPLERENLRLKGELDLSIASNHKFQEEKRDMVISNSLRKAGASLKMLDKDDAVTFGRAYFGINDAGEVVTEDGLTPDQYLTDLQIKKPHLWGPTQGGGAQGGAGSGGFGGKNPFSAESWNMTDQGRIVKEHGMERASAMAKAAGTTVGGRKPPMKK